ncbi:unnamed protein product [Ectocarpus sp. 12 AP-2014]
MRRHSHNIPVGSSSFQRRGCFRGAVAASNCSTLCCAGSPTISAGRLYSNRKIPSTSTRARPKLTWGTGLIDGIAQAGMISPKRCRGLCLPGLIIAPEGTFEILQQSAGALPGIF